MSPDPVFVIGCHMNRLCPVVCVTTHRYSPKNSSRFTKRLIRLTGFRSQPPVVVDATEYGDVLALGRLPYRQGVEVCGLCVARRLVLRREWSPQRRCPGSGAHRNQLDNLVNLWAIHCVSVLRSCLGYAFCHPPTCSASPIGEPPTLLSQLHLGQRTLRGSCVAAEWRRSRDNRCSRFGATVEWLIPMQQRAAWNDVRKAGHLGWHTTSGVPFRKSCPRGRLATRTGAAGTTTPTGTCSSEMPPHSSRWPRGLGPAV